ncbi:ABC transporter permease [Rhodohalobacter mucosus]|uniref:ABC transport system permease protein n=1 Tax=Rhodohalobacter mucosus TaxID=2079485 RepID=A0A316TX06_9BACT|nr:ABC transporter permease [Rhodohalobacter mucosus]PWN07949.1 hypothetical protein DDZ15_02760 [Rhodohalobacter mucosus]
MFRNHLLFAFRYFRRRKGMVAISSAGLIAGIAAFLFILQYAAFEFSVNRFHEHADDIYRVVNIDKEGVAEINLPPGFASFIEESVPGVDQATRFTGYACNGVVVPIDESNDLNPVREESCIIGDGKFRELFTFPLAEGNGDLSQPGLALLTRSSAEKYFGTDKVVGRTFRISNQFGTGLFTVSGVLQNLPETSGFTFNMILSFASLNDPSYRGEVGWADPNGMENGFTQTYLKIHPDADSEEIEATLTGLAIQSGRDDTEAIRLQPLSHLHLAPSIGYDLPTTGNFTTLLFILAVGLMIISVAWGNYINLTTALGLERSRQIGVQKSLGATRPQLISQFLTESFLFGLCCLLLALVLIELFQPLFNTLLQRELGLYVLNRPAVWITGGLVFIAGILISGLYVATVLTSLEPSDILKGNYGRSEKGTFLRQSMVVFQFAVSVLFIVVALVFSRQLDYMQEKDLGMEIENKLVIRGPSVQPDSETVRAESFKDELSKLSFVQKVSGSNNIPGSGYNFFANRITDSTPSPEDERKSYGMLLVDQNYLDTFDIQLLAGDTFSLSQIDVGWSGNAMILNRAATGELGFDSPEAAVESEVFWGENVYRVQGVIENYHHLGLQSAIDPMILLPLNANGYFTLMTNGDIQGAQLDQLRELYGGFFPGNPFEFFFLDEKYDEQYVAESRFSTLFTIASVMAIIIACLGLFGLAAYSAAIRTREIGVRKVLGASVWSIVLMLSRDFMKWVLIGYLIALPLSGLMMNRWLQNFAYRTELDIWIFLTAGVAAFFIAMITVGTRVLSSAMANPVQTLRTDG